MSQRTVEDIVWSDARFQALNERERLAWLFLLTAPEAEVGIYRLPTPWKRLGGWKAKTWWGAMAELEKADLIRYDQNEGVYWICRWSRYHEPLETYETAGGMLPNVVARAARLWLYPEAVASGISVEEWREALVDEEKRTRILSNGIVSTARDMLTDQGALHLIPRGVQEGQIVKPRSWIQEAGADWDTRYHGKPPYPRIGKALKPLVEEHGWDLVRVVWRKYLTKTSHEFATPERFASTFGSWFTGGHSVASKNVAEVDGWR